MKNVFLHFKSVVPFELTINGNYVGLIDNVLTTHIDILTTKENLYVTYLPISLDKTYVPYTFNIKNIGEPICENNQIKIIPYSNNHYEIVMSPVDINNPITLKTIYSKTIDQYTIHILDSCDTSYIYILENNCPIFKTQIPKCVNCYCNINKNYIIIECELVNRLHLCIYNLSTKSALIDKTVDSIKENKDTFKVLEKLNDILGQGIIYNIDLKNNDISKNVVFTNNNTPNEIKHSCLIPYAFLETIKQNNFATTKTLLDESLQNVTNNHFTEYFKEFENIYFNPYITSSLKINYVLEYKDGFSSYNFILKDGKIKDIEQVF